MLEVYMKQSKREEQKQALNFNLKTDRYRQRFFDAYGRESVEFDLLQVIAAAEIFG